MINNFRDKQARIKVMQEKADLYNQKFDELEQQKVDLALIPKILQEQDKTERHSKFIERDELPYEKQDQVINCTGRLGQGYDKAHTVLSQTKDMYSKVDEMHKTYILTKKNKQIDPQTYMTNKEKAASAKQIRREQIYKDHVKNLFQVVDDEPLRTDYTRNMIYTEDMKQIHRNRDYEYHQKMNDLKFYNEEYVKCKEFLRKC